MGLPSFFFGGGGVEVTHCGWVGGRGGGIFQKGVKVHSQPFPPRPTKSKKNDEYILTTRAGAHIE